MAGGMKIDSSVLEKAAKEYGARGLLVVSIEQDQLRCLTFASDPDAWGHIKEIEFVVRNHIDASWIFSENGKSYSIMQGFK